MGLTSNDLVVILGMVVAVILMNWLFGMADIADDQNVQDPPELNISADRFQFVGDRPEQPLGNNQFRVTPASGGETGVAGPYSLNDTTQLEADFLGSDCSYAIVNDVGIQDSIQIDRSNGTIGELEGAGWNVTMEVENSTACTGVGTITGSPEGSTGFLEGFVGGTAEAIAGIVAAFVWLVETAIWLFAFLIQAAFNMFGILFDVATFAVGLVGWLFGRMESLVTGASAWAAVALSIPILVLSLMGLKVALTLVEVSDWL